MGHSSAVRWAYFNVFLGSHELPVDLDPLLADNERWYLMKSRRCYDADQI
jgi:hypothetical protein